MASMTGPCSIQEQTLALRGKLCLGECGPVSACLGVCPDLPAQLWPATCCFWLFGDSGIVVLVLEGLGDSRRQWKLPKTGFWTLLSLMSWGRGLFAL